MKRSIIILAIALTLTRAHAQLQTAIGTGTDFRHAVASWSFGFQVYHAVIEGEISPSLTRDVTTHNYIGVKAGYNFNGIIPSIGYYYDHVSADKRYLNSAYAGFSIKAIKMVNDRAGVFINGLYIHKSFQLTGGIHYIFN